MSTFFAIKIFAFNFQNRNKNENFRLSNCLESFLQVTKSQNRKFKSLKFSMYGLYNNVIFVYDCDKQKVKPKWLHNAILDKQ